MLRFPILILVLCLLCTGLISIGVAQTSTNWTGNDGDWSDSSKWSNGTPIGQFHASISGNTGEIVQDMSSLKLSSLTIDSFNANLVLDNSITIADSFEFLAGRTTGLADLHLLSGSTAHLGGSAVFAGNGLNGSGLLKINGEAKITGIFQTDGFLELSGDGVIDGDGVLSVNSAFTWDGGIMRGSGVTYLNHGALIRGGVLDRTVHSSAGMILTGSGLSGTSNAVWNNLGSGAIFKISGDESLLGDGKLNNLNGAFFKKTGGTGTSVVEWDVMHEGQMILVQEGTLSLRGNSFLNGQLMVDGPGTLDFNGHANFGPNVSNAGEGTLSISGGTATFGHAYQADLDTVFSGGVVVSGVGDLSFNRSVIVQDSVFVGSGAFNAQNTASIAGATFDRPFHNFGQLTIAGDTATVFRGGFVQGSTGETNLDNSIVEFDSGSPTTIEGAITGSGTVRSSEPLIVEGTIAPGPGFGHLQFEGNLELLSDDMRFQIGDNLASDLITVTGDLDIDGRLIVELLDNATVGNYTLFGYEGSLVDHGVDLILPIQASGTLFHNSSSRQLELHITSIPEPVSPALIMGTFWMLFSGVRKRKSAH